MTDLRETFGNLRCTQMRLNPEKCAFRVWTGKLLGYLVSQRGIEANPEKIQAIQEMKPPTTVREAQRLTGCLVVVGRFISRSSKCSLGFFKSLRGSNPFKWTEEQQEAFRLLKDHLEDPEVLVSPTPEAPLLLYIAASHAAVSAALVQEVIKEGRRVQAPIYYILEALAGPKLRYTELEKMAYAVVMASRKLKHYFTSHPITISTSFLLQDVFENKESMGRISKWAAEIAPYALKFEARTAIKSQALADFIADWTPSPSQVEISHIFPFW